MNNNSLSAVPSLTTKSYFSPSRSIISATLVAVLVGLPLPANANLIVDPQATEIVDRDGDGRASSFTVRARADMNINEKGERYSGKVFEKRGHPTFVILLNTEKGTIDSGIFRQPGRDHSGPFTMQFSWENMEKVRRLANMRDEGDDAIYKGVMNGEIAVRSFELRFLESDTPQDRNDRFKGQWKWVPDNDVRVASMDIPLDNPLYLEAPKKDRLASMTIDSTPTGTTVYLDDEKIGKTPLTRELPVDVARNKMHMRLEKAGYKPLNTEPDFSPPAKRHYTLEKGMSEIAMDSDPAGATVRINGIKIGETPMSTERVTGKSVDIRVEMKGYKTAHFKDVSAPFEKTVALEVTDERRAAAAEAVAETANRASGRLPGDTDIGAKAGRADLPEPGEMANVDLKDAAGASPSVDMTGTWDTGFGTLRLRQFEGYVVGDYADKGMIAGRVSDACVAGVFTNGSRSGQFRFAVEDQGQFDGQWAWHGETLDGSWSGERTSSDAPARYRNFSVDGSWLQAGDSDRNVYDGTWDSNRGPVQLLARDQLLVGDYGSDGLLAGLWNGNAFVGLFAEGGRTGRFELQFFSRNGAFRAGEWHWMGEADDSRNWLLERQDSDAPSPDNMTADAPCR